ncbi:hypothetical protein HYALB_00009602 [Hymenoscyphus albidus]|uniref:Uncharacterized protein n=1 Tax=Hymenoscyphus albidus TaxID=595503 RepID=A0A9N9Q696_9HELO|nr:hypothetical protein HYALB_00009602 [Hymenoscyphus albidus]
MTLPYAYSLLIVTAKKSRKILTVKENRLVCTFNLNCLLAACQLSSESRPGGFSREAHHKFEYDIWRLYSEEVIGAGSRQFSIKFSSDLNSLRIGPQVLAKDSKGDYVEVLGKKNASESIPWYFEDFWVRDQSNSDPESSSSEEPEIDNGDEDWTDVSTDLEKLGFQVENEDSSASEPPKSSSEGSSNNPNSSTDFDSDDEGTIPGDGPTSEDEPRYSRNTAGEFAPFGDSDDNDSDMDVTAAKNVFRKSSTKRGMITVVDVSQTPPKQIFLHNHQLPVALNGSPPAIHPTQPLVVWPLSGGNVLFADFMNNSYFIRGFKPMIPRARHLFVKPRFSGDGKYLHFASLEAEVRLSPEDRKAFQKAIRKKKRASGKGENTSSLEAPSKVPKNNIYLPDSCRVREMQYYPPPLSNISQPGSVMIGSLNTISQRHIQEMPVYRQTDSHTDPLPDLISPPIGMFVSEEDLGGWISEDGRVIEVSKRAGGLQRKIENFDANDDCDVELFLGVQT